MNRYKIWSVLLAGIAACCGLLYLYADSVSLGLVLPCMAGCFIGISVISFLEARASGFRGFAALLPSLAAALVALSALIGWLVYWTV